MLMAAACATEPESADGEAVVSYAGALCHSWGCFDAVW